MNLLIDEITDIEWLMFSSVNNKGGKAACQEDMPTFRIMRTSQLRTWGKETLASYLEDLKTASINGRNLMSEKYARMMETTFPEEYARMKNMLPPVDPVAAEQINKIVAIHVGWKEQFNARYPHLAERGRSLHSLDDVSGLTSLETYMRAELETCSPKTVALYYAATLERAERGENEASLNILNQVRQYGFADLNEAEQFFSKH
jgi:hypothetical protein